MRAISAKLTGIGESAPQLDAWLPDPAVRVQHRKSSQADPDHQWEIARQLGLNETRMLGRLIGWRIPELPSATTFDSLFRNPPFAILEEHERGLVSGLVGRIWTLRRDYPQLESPQEFRDWSQSGTAKVMFAHWVEPADGGGSTLRSEVRVKGFGAQGRIGLASVRPLIRGFEYLIGADALLLAVRRAERD